MVGTLLRPGVIMSGWLGVQIRFMFSAVPLACAMVDRFGSYRPTTHLHVASFALIVIYRPHPVAFTPFRP